MPIISAMVGTSRLIMANNWLNQRTLRKLSILSWNDFACLILHSEHIIWEKPKVQNIKYQKRIKNKNNNKLKQLCKNQVINEPVLCHEIPGNSIFFKFSIASRWVKKYIMTGWNRSTYTNCISLFFPKFKKH